jgi:glucokinase
MSGGVDISLVADIGGTNARFALVEDGHCGAIHSYRVADFAEPADAIRACLGDLGLADQPRMAVLAVAGPVDSGRGQLTNGAWAFDSMLLAEALEIPRVEVVNDFAALARGLPLFTESDLHPVGNGTADPDATSVVLGPGTGLGVAAFVPAQGGIVLPTEGGHATMPAEDERESKILAFLRGRFGHVSAERVLSGQGLEALYEASRFVDGWGGAETMSAQEISDSALAGDLAGSVTTLKTFCAMLGGFAGNLALTMGAKGGVYVAGGIVPRFPEFLAASDFRARFEAKGRFRDWLSRIPTFVITHPDPAFPGLVAMTGNQGGIR